MLGSQPRALGGRWDLGYAVGVGMGVVEVAVRIEVVVEESAGQRKPVYSKVLLF